MVSRRLPALFDCECERAGCQECMDRWRGPFRQNLADFLNGFDTVTMITVIFTQPALRQDDLFAIDPVAVLQRTRMMLRRNGLNDLPMVGTLEADWSEKSKRWEPHLHLFVPGQFPDTKRLRLWLRSRNPLTGDAEDSVYRPVQRDRLEAEQDVVNAVAYATKFAPMRKRVLYRANGVGSTKVNLRGTQFRDAQRWLDRPVRDFVYLQNVRLDSTGFRLTGLLSGKPPKSSI